MKSCLECGEKLNDGAKFCHGCGRPVNKASQNSSNRRQEYGGEIVKCPNCGEVLNSFEPFCSMCGYELRGSKATDSVKEFEYKFERASSIDKKIDLIKTFAIPNTKEDILEFMILATSNMDSDSYDSSERKMSDIHLVNAWMSQFEKAYQKAKILFIDTSDFDGLYNIYLQKNKKIKSEKRVGNIFEFFNRNKECFPIFVFFVMLLFFWGSMSLPHMNKVNQLDKLTNQVEKSIEIGDYDTARIKANQIVDDTGWSDESKKKWDDIRESLLELIDEKQDIAEGKIYIGISSNNIKGQDYKTVIEQLKKRGFTNIREVAHKDLITGWLTSDGEVEKVNIEGETDFTDKSRYAADIEIIITYHTFK